MNNILKALLIPLVIAILGAAVYVCKMIHVWPPHGKETCIEEGIYMLLFHAFCVAILLPAILCSFIFTWPSVPKKMRWVAILSGLILLAGTVLLPELIIKNSDRIRRHPPSEHAP